MAQNDFARRLLLRLPVINAQAGLRATPPLAGLSVCTGTCLTNTSRAERDFTINAAFCVLCVLTTCALVRGKTDGARATVTVGRAPEFHELSLSASCLRQIALSDLSASCLRQIALELSASCLRQIALELSASCLRQIALELSALCLLSAADCSLSEPSASCL